VNPSKRISILVLLIAIFAHAAAAFVPLGEAADACESDCCVAALAATSEALAPGQCCVIECPPDAEIPPVITVGSPAPQVTDGVLPAAPPAHWLISVHAPALRALPRYLPDSSCRYLQTGALLI
jgi:hypothetical protein